MLILPETLVKETPFAVDVRTGLSRAGQKELPSTWLYDDLGSKLFEAITLLPEYGLTRAGERLLSKHSGEIASRMPEGAYVAELGSGTGKKTRYLLEAMGRVRYYPIDVSSSALESCAAELKPICDVRIVQDTFLDGLAFASADRAAGESLLVLFLGSTIGNFDRPAAASFLRQVHSRLRSGDALLMGADLVKPVRRVLDAYDDSLGVTAAFNLNILARINRELDANFDLRQFAHEARYCSEEQRVEMHLCSQCDQVVDIPGAEFRAAFREGETIWTESSHKYELNGLQTMARDTGFTPEALWTDSEWPFAECFWRV